MPLERQSGVLLHPTSLPGPYGIGSLGPAAHEFVDQLAQAGQQVWQVLPIHATGGLASPYSATTTFALNPLLADLDALVAEGLLQPDDLVPLADMPDDHVDYVRVLPAKLAVMGLAGTALAAQRGTTLAGAFEAYRNQHGEAWLWDYALYEVIKANQAQKAWFQWPQPLRDRDPAALAAFADTHAGEIAAVEAVQFLVERQWMALRDHAESKGIWLLGDMAIFVGHDSADTWVNPGQFKLDAEGHTLVQAGVPPDYFSETGQLWGNPIYDWSAQQADGFAWWVARMARLLQLTGGVRIDHFRGFAGCWEVPAGDTTAVNGQWVDAPGHALFEVLTTTFPHARVVAEDLGLITPDVIELRDRFALPGLKILQFEFGNGAPHGDQHPFHYPAQSVTYTGTHDNNTVIGWFLNQGADAAARAKDAAREAASALELLGGDGSDIHWRFIDLACGSGSALAIHALQDVLGLDGTARMNVPGTVAGNWQWRFSQGALTDAHLTRLRSIAEATGRAVGSHGDRA